MSMMMDGPANAPMDEPADACDSPAELAMALDAVLDEVSDALDVGDVATAAALVTAAEATTDALLDCLGVPDADEAA